MMRVPVVMLVVLAPVAAPAMTYVMMSDADLADRAPVIAEVRVAAVRGASGVAARDHEVVVERAVVGRTRPRLVVRLPGSSETAPGTKLHLPGMPELAVGDRALVFLAPNGDGTWHPVHLGLGVFRAVGGLAVRSLDGAHELPSSRSRATAEERAGVRDLARFGRWLTDRAAGVVRPVDYFTADDTSAVAAARVRDVWGTLRWFAFDLSGRRRTVHWSSHEYGQPGVDGGGHRQFRGALRAWSRHRGSTVRYAYVGSTGDTSGLDEYDGFNTIVFDWPLADPFDCEAGGVLAIGGPWYSDETRLEYRGRRYARILGADVVVNEGIECFFAESPDPQAAAEELFGHELGHTLGLGHACGDDRSGSCTRLDEDEALMRAYIHDDGRGAELTAHDRAAICRLYPDARLDEEACAAR